MQQLQTIEQQVDKIIQEQQKKNPQFRTISEPNERLDQDLDPIHQPKSENLVAQPELDKSPVTQNIDDFGDIPVNADADQILAYSEQILNRFNIQQTEDAASAVGEDQTTTVPGHDSA